MIIFRQIHGPNFSSKYNPPIQSLSLPEVNNYIALAFTVLKLKICSFLHAV